MEIDNQELDSSTNEDTKITLDPSYNSFIKDILNFFQTKSTKDQNELTQNAINIMNNEINRFELEYEDSFIKSKLLPKNFFDKWIATQKHREIIYLICYYLRVKYSPN